MIILLVIFIELTISTYFNSYPYLFRIIYLLRYLSDILKVLLESSEISWDDISTLKTDIFNIKLSAKAIMDPDPNNVEYTRHSHAYLIEVIPSSC